MMSLNEPSTSDSAASKRKVVCGQGRNITSNVYNCFKKLIFDEEGASEY
jgi:hypothetical protein